MNIFRASIEVRKLLLENTEVKAEVGGKIFPIVAPPDTIGNYITIQRDGLKSEYSKMGLTRRRPFIFVNVISEDLTRSLEIAEAIDSALEGRHILSGIELHLEDVSEDFEDKKYLQILRYSINSI